MQIYTKNTVQYTPKNWTLTLQGTVNSRHPANIAQALNALNYEPSYDAFLDRYMIRHPNESVPRLLDDGILSQLRYIIADRFKFCPTRQALYDTIIAIGRQNSVHPILDYLNALQWDGTPRLDSWLFEAMGCPAGLYPRTVGRMMLIAAVRRMRYPGTRFSMMPVFVASRLAHMPSGIAALCPDPAWFAASFRPSHEGRRLVHRLIGRWIIECQDVSGLRLGQIETIKAFLSRHEDVAGRDIRHVPTTYLRRCLIIGTAYHAELICEADNRTFLPLLCREEPDTEWMVANRDQLWAEAVIAEAAGEAIELPDDLWEVVNGVQEEPETPAPPVRLPSDPWGECLKAALGVIGHGRIPTVELWRLLDEKLQFHSPNDQKRLARLMKRLGWVRTSYIIGCTNPPRQVRGFVKGDEREDFFIHVSEDGSKEVGGIAKKPGSALSPRDGRLRPISRLRRASLARRWKRRKAAQRLPK